MSICFFSTLTDLSIKNSSLQVRTPMPSTIATSCDSLGRTRGGSSQTNDARTTGCPSWQCARAHLSDYAAVLVFQKRDSSSLPTLPSWFSSLWLLPLPQGVNKEEGAKIWHRRRHPSRIAESAKDADKNNFQYSFRSWQRSWDRCVRSQENYFEEDGGDQNFVNLVFLHILGNFGRRPVILINTSKSCIGNGVQPSNIFDT
jgi:hypothetical protein